MNNYEWLGTCGRLCGPSWDWRRPFATGLVGQNTDVDIKLMGSFATYLFRGSEVYLINTRGSKRMSGNSPGCWACQDVRTGCVVRCDFKIAQPSVEMTDLSVRSFGCCMCPVTGCVWKSWMVDVWPIDHWPSRSVTTELVWANAGWEIGFQGCGQGELSAARPIVGRMDKKTWLTAGETSDFSCQAGEKGPLQQDHQEEQTE